MNRNIIRSILALAVGFGCAAWSSAQEGNAPTKPQPAPKILSEAQLKTQAKQPSVRTKAKAAAAAKAKAAEVARALDLNHATKAELKKLPGLTDAYAIAIIAGRPYRTKADLVVKNVLPMDLYQTLRSRVKVTLK